MKNRDTQNRRRRVLPIVLAVICSCALVCGTVIFVVLRLHSPQMPVGGSGTPASSISSGVDLDPNAQDYTGQASTPVTEKANPKATQTQIPGYGSITLDTKTKELGTALHNPAGNPVYFIIRLTVDGKEVYKSKMIPPGQAVYHVKIETPLEKGTYDAILKYECFHVESLSPLNGADVNLKLVVE